MSSLSSLRRWTGFGLALGALTVSATIAGAGAARADSVAIGVDLGSVPTGSAFDCGATNECTLTPHPLGSQTLPGGLAAPVNGTITSFQLKTGGAGASAVKLRVLRPVAPLTNDTRLTGAGTSAPVDAPPNAVTTFPASLPIARRDQIGLDCCQNGNDAVSTGEISASIWGSGGQGPLADGASRTADEFSGLAGPMLNATIEIDDDLRILGKARRRGYKVRMQAIVPNPGLIGVSDKGPWLRTSRGFYEAPGQREISAALTDAAFARLRERGRFKIKVRVTYSPNHQTTLVRRSVRAILKP
jgi:hypothetical protein